MSYNGWSNRETWLVNVWFNPETVSDLDAIKEILWEQYETLPGALQDMCNLNAVDWEELAEHFSEADEEDED